MDDVGKQGHQTAASTRRAGKMQLDGGIYMSTVGACQ
jgi:hypothetical protein